MGEFDLIEKIMPLFAPLIQSGYRGIGDDCAVIPIGEGKSLVVTTDILIENVHFIRSAITPRELGAKSLIVSISDVAAMGAQPIASFLSIGLPRNAQQQWIDEFFDGYREVSERFSTALLGGDTSLSITDIVVNVLVIGKCDNSDLKFRNGAKPGDKIFVTGYLGDSGAGLKLLLNPDAECDPDDRDYLIKAHHAPRPHVESGVWLGKHSEVTAMMDVSDGIASDLRHILKASATGAEVRLDRLPVSEQLLRTSECMGWDALALATGAGEDYTLLFTADAQRSDALVERYRSELGLELYEIGTITDIPNRLNWIDSSGCSCVDYKGFSHF